ncbi:MAG: hypothetical protein GPOALKHO_000540 [Sodalis sp.]|nr:MAG: hypothetical protein GPOALKHO_000540 [Sodalis sp.]
MSHDYYFAGNRSQCFSSAKSARFFTCRHQCVRCNLKITLGKVLNILSSVDTGTCARSVSIGEIVQKRFCGANWLERLIAMFGSARSGIPPALRYSD